LNTLPSHDLHHKEDQNSLSYPAGSTGFPGYHWNSTCGLCFPRCRGSGSPASDCRPPSPHPYGKTTANRFLYPYHISSRQRAPCFHNPHCMSHNRRHQNSGPGTVHWCRYSAGWCFPLPAAALPTAGRSHPHPPPAYTLPGCRVSAPAWRWALSWQACGAYRRRIIKKDHWQLWKTARSASWYLSKIPISQYHVSSPAGNTRTDPCRLLKKKRLCARRFFLIGGAKRDNPQL